MTAGRRTLALALAALLATALLSLAGSAQQAAQNPRIALVIGNATYRDVALATTANDAGLIAQTLQAAGFDVVGARDLDGQSLRTAFRDFLDKASAAGPDMQAFVYLAGRGVQYDGDNYFVPVDAQINRDADVPIDALRISDFAHALAQTPGRARIIVLDAARANPYASQGPPLAPGLALVDPEPGELIAFNAAPGTLAGDEQGPYGVFGKTLAGAMRQGGVDVVEVFDQTRVTVNQQTQGALLPWSASKLTEPYYIFERAADAPPPAVATAVNNQPIAGLPAEAAYTAALQQDTISGYEEYLSHFPDSAQAPRVRAILAALREAYFWRRSVNTNTAHAYWTYLRRYSRGPHIADARRRLAMISAAYEPPPDFQPMTYQDLPPPPQDEGFYEEQPVYAFDAFGPPPLPPPPEYYQQYYYVEDDDWRDLPPPPPPVDVGFLPVLAIGIPLVVGAVGFQHYEHYHRDGIAPAGLPRFRPPPPAPPPLPRNVNPVQPPPPVPVRVTGPASGHVKPLPPIGPPAGPAAKPAAAPPPAPSPEGKTPAGTPAVTAPPGGKSPAAAAPAPEGKPPTPAPAAPALGKPPTVTPGAPAALPGAPVATPGGKPPAAVTVPPGAKPLPVAPALGKPPTVTPGAPAALPGAPVATPGGKPPAAVTAPPGAKPLPVAPNIATPSSGVPATPLSGKVPGVVTPPAGAKPPASTLIAPTPAKPSPVPPPPAATPNTIAKPLPKPPGPAPAPAVNLAPKPAVNPPSIAPAVPKAAPAIVHAPSPAAPVVHAPSPPPLVRPPPPVVHAAPPPPVVHAPPPPVVRAAPPPPVVHAPPPPVVHAPPPPPVVHAAPPPPVVHAPPPPVVHAAPPPPVVRPPPAAQHAPLCGNPGRPPCPK
jgi:uncharacterized caspase-like protein